MTRSLRLRTSLLAILTAAFLAAAGGTAYASSNETLIRATGDNGTAFVSEIRLEGQRIYLTHLAAIDTNATTGVSRGLIGLDGSTQIYDFFTHGDVQITSGTLATGDVLEVTSESGTHSENFEIIVEPEAAVCNGNSCEEIYSATCSTQTFKTPDGVPSVTFEVLGAGGGGTSDESNSSGGTGGEVETTLSTHPGQSFNLRVGGAGIGNAGMAAAAGGCYGGGSVESATEFAGASGGGGSFVSTATTLLIAAGGGGGAQDEANGGNGGQTGGNGGANGPATLSGKGATVSKAGAGGTGTDLGEKGTGPATSAAEGKGGSFKIAEKPLSGGGGGGGYYGGGSGATTTSTDGAGGGGSDYATSTGTHTAYDSDVAAAGIGEENGDNGRIVVRYTTIPTAAPTLKAPTTFESSKSPLVVTYELPEEAAPNSLILTFVEGGTITTVKPAASELTEGEHTILLNTHNLDANPAEVASATHTELPDGTYSLTISYQNPEESPAASASVTGVKIKTVTTAPTLMTPTTGSELHGDFGVTYSLPEVMLSNSLQLVFYSKSVGTRTLTLSDVAPGTHTVTIDPLAPEDEPGVSSGVKSIPYGTYSLTVEYQDELGNPVAESTVADVTLKAPLCQPGFYSATAEEPCSEATSGHYAEGAGATTQTPCEAGTYNPDNGSTSGADCLQASLGNYVELIGQSTEQECPIGTFASLKGSEHCIPAEPGHYVAHSGSSSQQECAAGTYSDEPGEGECTTTPEGSYSAAGAAFPTPCHPGTYDPHTGSTSSSACETDPEGFFSGEGAANATPCEAGTYDNHTGSTRISACELDVAGSWSAPGAATATLCVAGTYNPFTGGTSSAACREAGPGYSDPTAGLTEEIPCQPGTYAPLSGSEHCMPAGLGHYVSEQAQSAEQECVAGTYASATESIVCKLAETGHYVPQAGAASQQECVAGTYSERTEATTCSTTPEGNYSATGATTPIPCDPGTNDPHTNSTTSAACETDPAGSWSAPGAASATLCNTGTYNPNNGSTSSAACTPAGLGHYVPQAGAATQQECVAGTYSSVKRSTICLTAPKNTYTNAGAIEPTPCPTGTEAPAGSSACTAIPNTEVKTEAKIEMPKTTPPVEQPVKGHEATPIITKLKLNHPCVAPPTLVLYSPASQGLNLSLRLDETASIEYKIAPGKGAAKSTKCSRGKGHSKTAHEKVWTGPRIASKGKKKHEVPPAKAPVTLTAGSHQVLLAAALSAAHFNAKHLRPGIYVLTIIAVNAEGKRSTAETVKFWVIEQHPRVHPRVP